METNKLIFALGAIGVSALFAGCGGAPYGSYSSVSQTSSSTTTTTDTTATTAAATSGSPLYTFNISGVGYNPVSVTVQANSVLKVRFAPGKQKSTVAGTGFAPTYSKLGVYLAAGNAPAQSTALLSNGLDSAPEQSDILDFSGNIQYSLCQRGQSDCRETVTITVSQPNYDYWCLNYPSDYRCWETPGYSHVYDTHPWNGTLTVQTDDTVALQ